jgi:hypothetical protein
MERERIAETWVLADNPGARSSSTPRAASFRDAEQGVQMLLTLPVSPA